MSDEPKGEELDVSTDKTESEEDISLSEDAIASIVGDAEAGQDRDPEEVTADQVDALKGMIGSMGGAEEADEDQTVGEDDIASILEGAAEEISPEEPSAEVDADDIAAILENAESEEQSTEELKPEESSAESVDVNPEEATADQVDALAGLMGGFNTAPKTEEPSTAEEPVAEETAVDEPPPAEEPAEAANPEEATADQVDELAGLMGNFNTEPKAEEPPAEELPTEAAEPEVDAAEPETTKPEAEAAEPEPAANDTVDPGDIASILAAESPEVEETPEPEAEEGPVPTPENVAKGEGILTPDILEDLIMTMPPKPGEEKKEEKKAESAAPKVSEEEAAAILGDETIDEKPDEEEIDPNELNNMLDGTPPEEPKEEEEPVPEEAANIVTPEDDLEEEEELAEEEPAPAEEAPEPEQKAEEVEDAKPKKKRRINIPFPKLPKKVAALARPIGFAACVAFAGIGSSYLMVKFFAPKPAGYESEIDHTKLSVPVVGMDEQRLRLSDIQPAIDMAIEPYLEHFEFHQGWIHAVAQSGLDLSVTVPVTAVTKEPLYEMVDDKLLLSRLVLTPDRFDALRKELIDAERSPGPPRLAPPADRYTIERFGASWATRAVLHFYGTHDGDDWNFGEPEWKIGSSDGKLPGGFKASFLGNALPLDDPKVNAWVEKYNSLAQDLMTSVQENTELDNLSELQRRVDARLSLFEPFEILSGRIFTPDNLGQGDAFNAIITDVYEDGFFEGYFEMRQVGLTPKRFSGRVDVSNGPDDSLVQTAYIRTFRESGLETDGDQTVPSIFQKGSQDLLALRSEPGFLSGRIDDIYITIAKP